jgi:hypothetical protein
LPIANCGFPIGNWQWAIGNASFLPLCFLLFKGADMRENLPTLIAELKARMSTIRDSL